MIDNLPTWGQQYFAKNNLIFFVRSLDASTRAVVFNCRSIATVCFDASVSGVIGATLIRRFALFESNDLTLPELLDRDRESFNCLLISGGEIEASKRK